MTDLTIGSPAPDFTLPRNGEGTVTLSKLQGKAVILYFYPKDDTSGCTAEAIDFSALGAEFEAANAVVIGISPDSVKSHDKFAAKHALSVMLASDEDRKALEAYGVWKEKSMLRATRRPFLRLQRSSEKNGSDVTPPFKIISLRGGATDAVASADLDRKTALAQETATRWFERRLSLRSPLDPPLPERPGRPEKPELVPPTAVERRSLHTVKGRIALLHAIAHIELNAVDLALDIVARYASEPVPHSFFDGWMQVAFEEAKHFRLVRDRLRSLGADYGDLPAHDGLWQAAHSTRNDLTARLAVVPLILEARGLDVTPSLQARMRETGDLESAAVLDVIYNDEKGHVAIGAKWFRFLCAREKKDPAATFKQLVRANFRGPLKPPFNDLARAEAGLTPSFYRSLTSVSHS
ncbi:hypothetical protein Lal_00010544 [Lupinus albus]|nr:hypothetical protein Lal_00010544 [Lupinus albus]